MSTGILLLLETWLLFSLEGFVLGFFCFLPLFCHSYPVSDAVAQGEKSLFWHSKGFRLAQRAQSLIFPAGNFERVSLFGSVI